MTTPALRLLIVDDHAAVRRGVRALLEERRDIQIVAEAADGRSALAMALETRPDIAIVDYSLPDLDGRDLTLALKRELPEIEILIYTADAVPATVIDVLRAGARGVVLKFEAAQHLFAAIDALSIRQPYFSGCISEMLLDEILRKHGREDGAERS